MVRSSPTRSTRTTRRPKNPPVDAASRAARVPMDRTRRGGPDGGGVHAAERSAQLERRHGGAEGLRRAVAELRVRRGERTHRLLRARDTSRFAHQATAPSRPTAGPATRSGPATSRSRSFPTLYDPPSHFIVTANNRPSGRARRAVGRPGVPEPLPCPAHRRPAARTLGHDRKLTPDDFARIQADTVSLHARDAASASAGARATGHDARSPCRGHPSRTGTTTRGVMRPRRRSSRPGSCGWHRRSSAMNSAPLPRATRGASPRSRGSSRRRSTATLSGATTSPPASSETCDEAVTTALHVAVEGSVRANGTRTRAVAVGRRAPGRVPASGTRFRAGASPLLSRSVPNGGDWSTVNVGPVAVDAPYEQQSIPGYREIVDLSPANDSRFLEVGRPVGALPVEALRRSSLRIGRPCAIGRCE